MPQSKKKYYILCLQHFTLDVKNYKNILNFFKIIINLCPILKILPRPDCMSGSAPTCLANSSFPLAYVFPFHQKGKKKKRSNELFSEFLGILYVLLIKFSYKG